MRFITKRMQLNLHNKHAYYRAQNMHPHECHKYALRDLGLPEDFRIEEYTVVTNDDSRALDNQSDFKGLSAMGRLIER